MVFPVDGKEGTGGLPGISQSQVFFNGHIGSRAPQGVLIQAADVEGPFVVLLSCNILVSKTNLAAVRKQASQNGIKKRCCSGTG